MKRSELKSLIKEVLKEHAVSSYKAAEVALKDIVDSMCIGSVGQREQKKFYRKYGLYLVPRKEKMKIEKGLTAIIPFTTPAPNALEFPETFQVEIKITPLQTFIDSPKKVP
jgi:hypothetical protein